MERALYQQLAEIEDVHWWFVYRRKLISHLLERSGFVSGSTALDIGSGTGGNMPFLRTYCGNACGVDLSQDAIALACIKYPEFSFLHGDINQLRSLYSAESFDLVSDFSVLCHSWVESDLKSMRDVSHVLRPGGVFVLTEAAFPFLFRTHDRLAHVARRYTLPQVRGLLEEAGFRDVRGTYFNLPVFPVVFGLALADRLGLSFETHDNRVSELQLPPKWLNEMLGGVLKIELAAIRTVGRIPLGVSIACVARKA